MTYEDRLICPECSHDMFNEFFCGECDFEGVGYCDNAWMRMVKMYYSEEDVTKWLKSD